MRIIIIIGKYKPEGSNKIRVYDEKERIDTEDMVIMETYNNDQTEEITALLNKWAPNNKIIVFLHGNEPNYFLNNTVNSLEKSYRNVIFIKYTGGNGEIYYYNGGLIDSLDGGLNDNVCKKVKEGGKIEIKIKKSAFDRTWKNAKSQKKN